MAARTESRKSRSGGGRRRQAGGDEVRVRMYRRFLGDCFLLTLPRAGERPFYLMIDCGTILGTAAPGPLMEKVVSDVIATTGGHVDLLVLTHEHWDHLSGFLQARDLFAAGDGTEQEGKLHVHDLWLAWTEDPRDDLGKILRGERERTRRGLRLALQRLRAAEADAGAGDDDRGWTSSRQVESLLGFFGARGGGTAGALEAARSYARRPPRYCRPGEPPIELAEVPGVRFWVLGPPRDEKLIKKSQPSRAHPEVYETAFALGPGSAFLASALGAEDGFAELAESRQPFDARYRIPETQARELPFFRQRYWGDCEERDFRDQGWRRIDADWLGAAVDLALKLDDDTNNTSLVLAIELVESGRVLLFPGDAQVGNWLSWEGLEWRLPGGETCTAHDLLTRTVLYKVGHHGSHNATLRDKGLELMTHPELVAMVPVDHEMAKKKRWHEIPFAPLLERLNEKACGRVLRGDEPEKIADKPAPEGVSKRLWRAFQGRVDEDELYFEYRVPG